MKLLLVGLISLFIASGSFAGHKQLTDSKDNISIGGKIFEQSTYVKPVTMVANEKMKVGNIGAILKANQKALFGLEVIYRDTWNNSNRINCSVYELNTNNLVVYAGFPLIDTSHYNNVPKTSGTPFPTTGTRTWAVFTNPGEATLVSYDVFCEGYQYGYAPNLTIRLTRTIFE